MRIAGKYILKINLERMKRMNKAEKENELIHDKEKTNELIKNVYNWDVVNDGNIESIKNELRDMNKKNLERMSMVLESEDRILKETDTVSIFLSMVSVILAMIVVTISIINEPVSAGKFQWFMAGITLIWIIISGRILLRKKLPSYRRNNNKIICTRIAVKELYDEKTKEEKEKIDQEIRKEEERKYKEQEEKSKAELTEKLEELEEILKIRIKEEIKDEIETKEEIEIIEKVEEKLKENIEEDVREEYKNVVDDELTSHNWRN